MVFSSIVFLLYFFPIFFLVYYLINDKYKNYFILASSIAFYSWGAPKFIFVILGTTLLDFFLVKKMDSSRNEAQRKAILIVSLCVNVGLLFYFKYCNFFIENINEALAFFGVDALGLLNVVLPIGISFYTFESLTYVIDVYRKEHKPLKSFFNYMLYIILFPKLIAGPIIRYNQIADQITNRFEKFTYNFALKGFHRFVIGLSKKVIIANSLGEYADLVYGVDPTQLSGGVAWLGAFSYTMQIYFDFSGYSDMAIGLGQMMGFKFPENFTNPYTSSSITEFWRKWHITLGTWMRNYLYIPLGGNRTKSKFRLYLNLWLVFLLSGFWHGAEWTFIVWGIFHGVFLIIERLGYAQILEKIGRWPAMLLTFLTINFGWVFFREESLSMALEFINAMFSFGRETTLIAYNTNQLYSFLVIAFVFSFFYAFTPLKKIQDHVYFERLNIKENIVYSVVSIMLLLVCISLITASSFNPFIYFRF